MNEPINQSFWERLAARTRSSGALETIEDPMTIVRLATATLFTSAVVAGLGGLFMALFDEPVAGVAYLVLGGSFLVAWVFYATTGDTRSTELIVLLASAAITLFVHAHIVPARLSDLVGLSRPGTGNRSGWRRHPRG